MGEIADSLNRGLSGRRIGGEGHGTESKAKKAARS